MTDKPAKPALRFGPHLKPIFILALGVAVVAWSAAWIFRDNFEFSATLLGIGCFPIIIAVVAYLLILLKKLKQS